ncbi:hypothetical protein WEI85_35760 [Actinomycetes bacterium KLBMP 9797]
MPGLSYESEFHFEGWTDNVDLVTASGDNGFNVRFAALEAELQKIADAPLEPGSVRTAHLDLVAGTTVTHSLTTAAPNIDIVVATTAPRPMLPLLNISSTTPNAVFSVTTVYKTAANPADITVVFRVQNLSAFTVAITATPHLLRA